MANGFLEEEIYLNSETGEYETRLIDKRTKKSFIEYNKQEQVNKTLEFPLREDNLEYARVKRDVIIDVDMLGTIGVEDLSISEQKLYDDYVKRKQEARSLYLSKRAGGRHTKPISEQDIRYSMVNSHSIKEAANFLKTSTGMWKKYASLYIDNETGKNLYELHIKKCWGADNSDDLRLKRTTKNIKESNPELYDKLYKRLIDPETGTYVHKDDRRIIKKRNKKIKLYDVIRGLHPTYNPVKLKKELLKVGWFKYECECCNYNTMRDSDNAMSLILNFKDGNIKNKVRDNLEMLCFNCYFNKSKLWKIKRYYAW